MKVAHQRAHSTDTVVRHGYRSGVAMPHDATLQWVLAAAPPGTSIGHVEGLRAGGSPWLVSLAGPGAFDVVLRLGSPDDHDRLATEVAALERVGPHGVPAPRLLAADLTARVRRDVLAVLTTRVTGTSRFARAPAPDRLRALGAAVASIQSAPAPNSPDLPHRERPINGVDFDQLRRDAPARPLLVEAERVLAELPVPQRSEVFVHGDFWHGNTMWDGDRLTAIIDWDCAGSGHASLDLGSLRCDAALCWGMEAVDEVVVGYEDAAGHPAVDVAYWDLVAGLATPPTMGWFVDTIRGQGREDLDEATLLARRDQFLEATLDRL
jgi:aminoglycoside phosphotransferase (APT) family kinase protein